MSFTPFEHDLLRALLAGDHPALAALREQFASASVERRDARENGFTTWIRATAGEPVDDVDVLDDLQVELEGAATPADAVLHLEDGRLRSLECYVYEGAFPPSPRVQSAWYYGTRKFSGIGEELFAARDVEAALDLD